MHTNVGRLLYFLQSWFQIMNTNVLSSQFYRSSYMHADASSETAKFLIVIKTSKKFGKEKISTNTNCNSWSVVFIFSKQISQVEQRFHPFSIFNDWLIFWYQWYLYQFEWFQSIFLIFVIAINSYYFFIKIIKLFFNLIYQFIIFCF